MSLKETIQADMITAMKAKASDVVSALRMVISEIKKREIDGKKTLTDVEIQKTLSTLIKQRKDSIDAFLKGDRKDLAEKEEKEIQLLQKYLPEPLSEEELRKIVDDVISETGANGAKDLGKVMPLVMGKAAGRADGKLLSNLVREKLSSS